MNGETWTNYIMQPAPRTLLCQFRREDGFTHVGYAKDFLPEFNISGLEWKLTGIAREELDRMPLEVRRRAMPLSASCGWAQGLSANSGLFTIGAMDGGWPGQIFG